MIAVSSEAVRCAEWARHEQVDPIGTAGTYDGYLLVDLPLPWPRDIGEAIGDDPAIRRAAELGIRVQATVPADDGIGRAVLHRRPPGDGYRSMVRTALTAPPDEVLEAAGVLLAGGEAPVDDRCDVLVCTHGRRDTCCGSAGTRLAGELGPSVGGTATVSRTSHTGGHRFAPTVLVLPEATAWAFADADLVERVVGRTGDAADLADRYRGCGGLRSPRHQALEREVLREVGWPLFERHRRGIDLDGGAIALVTEAADGTVDRWEADVTPGRSLPVPDCGSPIEQATKAEHEWVVRGLRRLGPSAGA